MAELNNPVVGCKGLWELKSPFESLLPTNSSLTCTAISNYSQLYSMGIDVWATYYNPNGISKVVYQEHLDGEGRIVFLKSDSGKSYSFPLHYLTSFPVGTGVDYVSFGIGVRLGALPTNDDKVELLTQQIKELANLTCGVDVQVEFMALSDIFIVENASHERLLKARAAKKTEQTPSLERILDLSTKLTDITNKLSLAETKIIEQANEIVELKKKIP